MWNLKNKINEQTKQKQTHRHKEQTEGGQPGEGWGWGLGEKGEGIKKYKLVVTKRSWDIKYSTGNRVNSIVITMCGAR